MGSSLTSGAPSTYQHRCSCFCDNVSTVYLAHKPVQHRRTKHIELDIHFVREKVALGAVRVLHVPSSSQYAGIFTKGLPAVLFHEFRSSLHLAPLRGSDYGGLLESPASRQLVVPYPADNAQHPSIVRLANMV